MESIAPVRRPGWAIGPAPMRRSVARRPRRAGAVRAPGPRDCAPGSHRARCAATAIAPTGSRQPGRGFGWIDASVAANRSAHRADAQSGDGPPGRECATSRAAVPRHRIADRAVPRTGGGEPVAARQPIRAPMRANPAARAGDPAARAAAPGHGHRPTPAPVSTHPRSGPGSPRRGGTASAGRCGRPAHPPLPSRQPARRMSSPHPRTRPWNAPNASPCCTAC